MYAHVLSCPVEFYGESGAFVLCIKDFNLLGRRCLAMITPGIEQDFPFSVRAQSPGRVERSPNVRGLPRIPNCRHAIRPPADCERAVGNDLYDCRTPEYQRSVPCEEAGPCLAYLLRPTGYLSGYKACLRIEIVDERLKVTILDRSTKTDFRTDNILSNRIDGS